MPPDGRSRPAQAAPPNATDVESITLRELPMAFQWSTCPRHAFLRVSVILIADAPPWCVGAAEVHGHWVDSEQVAA